MRNHIATFVLPLAIAFAGAAGEARADRYFRGLELYQAACTHCHSMNWQTPGPEEKGKTDLTRVVDHRDDASLKRWMRDPQKEKDHSGCVHRGLTEEQIEDLVSFFKVRAAPAPQKPKPLPPSHAGKKLEVDKTATRRSK
jgi:cytochrome c1